MPIKDLDRRREYDRIRKQAARSAPPQSLTIDPAIQIKIIDDALELLARAAMYIETDPRARGTERGRALAYVASIAFRAVEAKQGVDRWEALERAIGLGTEAAS